MKKINDILKKDWIILIIIILGFVLGAYFYKSLPDRVPIHWNAKGEVNGYGSKSFGAFGTPLINLGLYLLFLVLPYIDPKGKNYESFKSAYQYLKYILVIFLFGIEIITFFMVKNSTFIKPIIIPIMVSLLFIFMGIIMGRIKNNYFVGIRTPWTLANDEVWRKTHRMAGPLWVIGGILNILVTLIDINFTEISFIIMIILIVIVPIVYSYIIYKKINSIK